LIDPLLINTIVYSCIIGLSSLGLTLTYITTKVPNFAHGIFLIFGSYITFTIGAGLNLNPYYSLPLAFLFGGGLGLLEYFAVLLPISKRGGDLVSQMVSTLAFSIVMYGVLNAYASYLNYTFNVQSRDVTIGYLDYTLGEFRLVLIVSILLVVGLIISLYLFLNKTRIGIAIRATVENASLAEGLGVNTRVVYSISWFLSGGITALAGSLYPLQLVFSPYLAYSLLLSIFAASVLGGLNSLFGGFLGGLIEGVLEKYVMAQLSIYLSPLIGVNPYVINQYSSLVPLIVVALVLLFLPKGIMGSRVR